MNNDIIMYACFGSEHESARIDYYENGKKLILEINEVVFKLNLVFFARESKLHYTLFPELMRCFITPSDREYKRNIDALKKELRIVV